MTGEISVDCFYSACEQFELWCEIACPTICHTGEGVHSDGGTLWNHCFGEFVVDGNSTTVTQTILRLKGRLDLHTVSKESFVVTFKVCDRVGAGHCHEAGLGCIRPRLIRGLCSTKGSQMASASLLPLSLDVNGVVKGTGTEKDLTEDLQSVRPCWLF